MLALVLAPAAATAVAVSKEGDISSQFTKRVSDDGGTVLKPHLLTEAINELR